MDGAQPSAAPAASAPAPASAAPPPRANERPKRKRVPTQKHKPPPPSPLTPPVVVVVGAGLAGVGCAKTLVEHGAAVVVVEARQRVGGRCCTADLGGGVTVDMGASWIHGVRKNPLYAEACGLGLHCVDTGADVALRDGETGEDLARSPDDAAAFAAFNAALGAARKAGEAVAEAAAEAEAPAGVSSKAAPRHGVDQSLGPGVEKALKDAAAPKSWRRFLQWHEANLEYANATSLSNLSCRFWDQDDGSAYVRRADLPLTSRGDAATWIFRGHESRPCRDVDIPWRRVAATPRPRRGYSAETKKSQVRGRALRDPRGPPAPLLGPRGGPGRAAGLGRGVRRGANARPGRAALRFRAARGLFSIVRSGGAAARDPDRIVARRGSREARMRRGAASCSARPGSRARRS